MEKTIVILAKSYKNRAWCIAGKEVLKLPNGKYKPTQTWIRPVSNNPEKHGAIEETQCQFSDGGSADVLDIVTISFVDHAPEAGQPENWLIDGSAWKKEGRLGHSWVGSLLDEPSDLWVDASCDTNSVSLLYDINGNIQQSLYLIQPNDLSIHLTYEYDDYSGTSKKKAHASFRYNEKLYEGISITDPKIRRIFTNQYPDEGGDAIIERLNNADGYWLCISLSPRFGPRQSHYKLAASIIDKTGYIQRQYKT